MREENSQYPGSPEQPTESPAWFPSPTLRLPSPDLPQFNRTIWIIAIAIVLGQIINLIQLVTFWEEIDAPSPRYFIWGDASGLIVYCLGVMLMVWDMDRFQLSARRLFNFDFSVLGRAAREIGLYFLGAALVVGFLAWLIPTPELELAQRSGPLRLSAFFLVVIVAPVVEEILFRGYLQASMERKFPRTNERLVVNAMFFAAAHVFILFLFLGAGVPYYIFVLGFLLAKLYDTHRSVLPGIVLHALNNGFVFLLEYLRFVD